MFKFLVKLAIIIIGLFIISQMPYFQELGADIKGIFYEKVDNVVTEVDRVKGEVEETKENFHRLYDDIMNTPTQDVIITPIDFKKDTVAHPERSLPRGLISLEQARQVTMYILLVMVLFTLLAGMLLNTQSAISYLAITIYLGLMYKEFFIGKWLEGKPVFYAISHQIVIFAICVFTITVIEPGKYLHPQTFYLCVTITSAFFGYEICRKLDPKANKILKT